MDHPLLRASLVCPFCHGAKDTGLVACWPCYRKHDMKFGGGEYQVDRSERILARAAAAAEAVR